jgi:hypothetical protein
LFSSSFSLIEEEDKEGISAFEQEFWEYTDSCIVWRIKQFRGPVCFFSIIIFISLGFKVLSNGFLILLLLLFFFFFSRDDDDSTTTTKERGV